MVARRARRAHPRRAPRAREGRARCVALPPRGLNTRRASSRRRSAACGAMGWVQLASSDAARRVQGAGRRARDPAGGGCARPQRGRAAACATLSSTRIAQARKWRPRRARGCRACSLAPATRRARRGREERSSPGGGQHAAPCTHAPRRRFGRSRAAQAGLARRSLRQYGPRVRSAASERVRGVRAHTAMRLALFATAARDLCANAARALSVPGRELELSRMLPGGAVSRKAGPLRRVGREGGRRPSAPPVCRAAFSCVCTASRAQHHSTTDENVAPARRAEHAVFL